MNALSEIIAAALAEHAQTVYYEGLDPTPIVGCLCGWRGDPFDSMVVRSHRTHVAEEIVKALRVEQVGWHWRYTDEEHLWSFDVGKPSGAATVDVPVFIMRALDAEGAETK